MRRIIRLCSRPVLGILGLALLGACGQLSVPFGDKNSKVQSPDETYSGHFLASSSQFSTVALFNAAGEFVKIVRDLNAIAEIPYGIAWLGNGLFHLVVDGNDRVETLNLATGAVTTYYANVTNLVGTPIQGIVSDGAGSVYVIETNSNTIERFSTFDGMGIRVGNPYIGTTIGTCVLATPRNMILLPNGNLAVINSGNGRLNIYNVSTATPTCVTAVTAAPFSANAPMDLAYHGPSDKIVVVFNTSSAIATVNTNGTSPLQVYSNTTIVLNPTAIAIDPSGYLYVANTGFNSVEKFLLSGGTVTRALNAPFIAPSAKFRAPTALMRIP